MSRVPGKLPEHLELQRTRVFCKPDAPTHTESRNNSGSYISMGVDNSVTVEKFIENLKIEVIELTDHKIEFDIIGIDASLANAFRRILIAEVPTMAIEKVLFANNTSAINDEVLSHRLGLIPITVDPRPFEYMSANDTANERNTLVFKLHARCGKGERRQTVLSKELKWLPNGSEFEKDVPLDSSSSKPTTYTSFTRSQESLPGFPNKDCELTIPDITIARLAPGQEIELEAHAIKGIGKTHAKWSPVGTAWYKMCPEVVLLKDIEGDEAERLVKRCAPEVFDIEDIKGTKRAVVARPRQCTQCRECLRNNEGRESVSIRLVKNHFIFTIESTGALPPQVLFTEAVKILENKCELVISDFLKSFGESR